jgi:1-acyl-sn-glycerol-3-phosphate acyltransferase
LNTALGVLRMAAVTGVAICGLLPVFLASLIPFTIRGARASLWVVVYLARVFNLIFNVHVHCLGKQPMCNHSGFVFVNHMSYLEALALISLTPVRFLAAAEVRVRPVSGWMAAQIGTIFAQREDKGSRAVARKTIEHVMKRSHYPPLVVFPEGRLGRGDRVLPFSYGAFEIAVQNSVPYLVCALQYNLPDVAIWHGPRGERLASALWRLAKSRGKVYVDIMPLYLVTPSPDDDARQLARAARRSIAVELGLGDQVPV